MLSLFLFTSVASLWLFVHQTVRHRFADLETNLSTTYNSAIAVSPETKTPAQLIALCVDLMRKAHCTDPFEALSTQEQRMVLHAHALDQLPAWMSHYAALGLPARHRALLAQLRHVKASEPAKPHEHFGAVQELLRLRKER